MKDESKTKKQLIRELNDLRRSVAELKGFEEEIKQKRASYEKFAKAFLQTSIPMAITTLKEERLVDVSNAFLNLMGWKREEVIGRTSLELGFTEEQRASFSNELNKRGCIENLEMKVRTKGGVLRDGLFNAVMMSFNNEKYLLTAMTDITEHKRLKEELRISEERYRKIFEDVPIGLWQSSLEGRYLRANQHLANILGYDSPEDLIQSVTDIGTQIYANPEDRDEATRLLRENGFFENFERQFRKKDGHYTWDSLNARAVRDAKGNVLYFEGSSKDITERKLTEERMQESEKKYRTIVENTNDAIYIHDFEGNIIDVNENACRMVGYSKEELVGKNIAEIDKGPPFKIPKLGDIIQESSHVFERENVRKDGSVVPIEVSLRIIETNGKGLIQAFVRDITERKCAEEVQRKSEEKFRSIVEQTTEWIWEMDMNWVHKFSNHAIEPILGYRPDELNGLNIDSLFHPEDLATIKVKLPQLIAEKRGWRRWTVRCRHKDGSYRFLESNADPIIDSTGHIQGYRGADRDVTDRKRAEEELIQSEKKYRAILDSASDAIMLGDERGNLIEANCKAEELFG